MESKGEVKSCFVSSTTGIEATIAVYEEPFSENVYRIMPGYGYGLSSDLILGVSFRPSTKHGGVQLWWQWSQRVGHRTSQLQVPNVLTICPSKGHWNLSKTGRFCKQHYFPAMIFCICPRGRNIRENNRFMCRWSQISFNVKLQKINYNQHLETGMFFTDSPGNNFRRTGNVWHIFT